MVKTAWYNTNSRMDWSVVGDGWADWSLVVVVGRWSAMNGRGVADNDKPSSGQRLGGGKIIGLTRVVD